MQDVTPLIQPLDWTAVAVRLGLAAAFGAAIGWERKMSDKPADVRTMMLIAAGAAAFAVMGIQITATVGPDRGIQADPTRVLAYIISGVGFLGAGAILHSKKSIRGLTTAAAIWAAAGVGAACGLGLLPVATTLFAIVFVALWVPWAMHAMGLRAGGDEEDERSQAARALRATVAEPGAEAASSPDGDRGAANSPAA